ncbi:MAG: hypothetical protein IKV10_04140, partial [Alphaproteobacteria bacterium]|nr:hypothetical protein [Alphaproteobacteria bacterium]
MRMYRNYFIIVSCLAMINCAVAQTVAPFSQYGQIQGVKNYSSNPFWNPSGPYNQRMPQAVYVDGPEINAGDCQRTVSALVANFCDAQNKCAGTQLSDVRPTLMLQLSQLPGHNFAASCAGYIDTEYKKYMSQNSFAAVQSASVAFPDVKSVSAGATQRSVADKNIPQWQRDVDGRAQKLQALQAQQKQQPVVTVPSWQIDAPAVVSDLGADERTEIKAQGYEPFKDMSAYHPLKNIVFSKTETEAQETLPHIDVCEPAIAATGVDNTGQRLYSFAVNDADLEELKGKTTGNNTWAVKFSHGTFVGTVELGSPIGSNGLNGSHQGCRCPITKYVTNDDKAYTEFAENIIVSDVDAAWEEDVKRDYCLSACISNLASFPADRARFISRDFPHNQATDCAAVQTPTITIDNFFDEGAGVPNAAVYQAATNIRNSERFPNEVCPIGAGTNKWSACFYYGALRGEFTCQGIVNSSAPQKCLCNVENICLRSESQQNSTNRSWNDLCGDNSGNITNRAERAVITAVSWEYNEIDDCTERCPAQCAFLFSLQNPYSE